jgi:antitoxin component YwqK of YwqJK toxin-antitoxin module
MSEEVKWKREYHSNGQLNWETPYVNEQVHGIQRYWHFNGQLAWETSWVNNQRHGVARFWYSEGKLWKVQKWRRGQIVINLSFGPIPGDAAIELDLITNILTYE